MQQIGLGREYWCIMFWNWVHNDSYHRHWHL